MNAGAMAQYISLDADDHRLPPHSLESEQAALGCLLLSPRECTPIARERIGDDGGVFYDLRHQRIYRQILALHDQGAGVDVITVQESLRDAGHLEEIGGFTYLSTLESVPASAANLDFYLDILREKHELRKLVQTCTGVVSRVNDHESDLATLTDDLERTLQSLRNGHTNLLPPIADVADFLAEPIIPPRELIYGILHQGSKMVLGGGSKTFKTWTLIDLAVAVATGEPWLSFKTTKGRVLFLNFEIQPGFFQQRIKTVAREKHVTLTPGQLDVWNLRGYSASYEALIPRIIERVRGKGYALIILDPIYKLYGDTDENAAGAVALLLNALESLTSKTGAAVAFGAHYSKGNQAAKESIDRISGSGVFARDPDSILNFTRHEEPDAFTLEATLRNFKPVEPFVVRWLHPLMRRDEALDPAKLKQTGGRPKRYTVDKLLSILKGQQLKSENWFKIASSETGIGRTSFYDLLEIAKHDPKLEQMPTGQWLYEDTPPKSS